MLGLLKWLGTVLSFDLPTKHERFDMSINAACLNNTVRVACTQMGTFATHIPNTKFSLCINTGAGTESQHDENHVQGACPW